MFKVDKFRLLFFGSDVFSARVLNHLLCESICPIHVITKPDSLLDRFALQKKLIRHKWPHDSQVLEAESFNIGLVASFGSLIEEKIVEKFNYGLFNVHPSLLPRYRGSTPVQASILDGVKVTGCTIMQIPPVAKFDIGDIIMQKDLTINQNEYAHQLRDRLADLGAEMTVEFLSNYDHYIEQKRPQGQLHRSYAKKLKPEQGRLDFGVESSELIDRKIRAYTGFVDLFVICLGGLKVRLEEMSNEVEVEKYDLNNLVSRYFEQKTGQTIVADSDIVAGTMFFHKIRHLLCIKCHDNRWLAFRYATPSAKSRMTAADFYNGYLSKCHPIYRRTDS